MESIREKLDELKKKADISTDKELLGYVYDELKKYKKQGIPKDKDAFISSMKGSFSNMVDGKRPFDEMLFLPLERVFGTSMLYLLDGRGETKEGFEQKGIRYAAYVDKKGNYDQLFRDDVYCETDEYGCSLLDYIVEYRSSNGMNYLASKNLLPIHGIGITHGVTISFFKTDPTEIHNGFGQLLSTEAWLNYFDGFRLVEKGIYPAAYDSITAGAVSDWSEALTRREDVRHALCSWRSIPLAKANPTLVQAEGDGAFANFLVGQMLIWVLQYPYSDDACIELLQSAIEINKEVMPKILALGEEKCRIDDLGYVFSGKKLCGCIVKAETNPCDSYGDQVKALSTELRLQVEAFVQQISGRAQRAIINGKLFLEGSDNSCFYDFYRLLNESHCSYVPIYFQGNGEKDYLSLPEGRRVTLSEQQLKDAVKMVRQIDDISEDALGAGNAYVFVDKNGVMFYGSAGILSCLIPFEIVKGGRYENLASLLASTCLLMPNFYERDQVTSVVGAMREYGIKKSEGAKALADFKAYFKRVIDHLDGNNPRDRVQIANANSRSLWFDLFSTDILNSLK